MVRNVIITGIGGQGVVTAAGLLRWAALASGFRLTGYDNRGGAQRLGHVAAVLRFTDEPDRPLAPEIPGGACDLLISLEASEGLRFARTLGPATAVVHAMRVVVPTNQRRARAPYVTLDDCRTRYVAMAGRVFTMDFDRVAHERFGRPVLGNLVALGAGLHLAGFDGLGGLLASQLDGDGRKAFDLGTASVREGGA